MNRAYSVVWTREIRLLSLVATLYRHDNSGAEIVHLSNNDTNKCFAIGFQTVPSDSTGIAHILEHSVLAGSKKYPVKDPFAILLKSSQKTFLNAMTYPDKTIYPVASQNEEDFKNLISVYLDAVFHPLLTEQTFKQEGWHYELSEDSPLSYKGVVYNEMKGAYSNVDGLIEQYMLEAIFPNTQYAHDSGGNPEVIPQLTHRSLVDFHQKNYHPSRAKVYFYGKLDIEKYLDYIEPLLRCEQRAARDNEVRLQQIFSQPKQIHRDIPTTPEKAEKGGAVVLGWMLSGEHSPLLSAEEKIAAWILTAALIDSDASPFKKKLLESRLGESLAGIGFEGDVQQPMFYMGLKQVKESDFTTVEQLFISELQSLAQRGLEKKFLESIMSKLEFELREMNASGSYPKAVSLYLQMMTSWNYGGDPLEVLDIEAILTQLKSEIARETGYFDRLLKRFLVDNAHRVTLFLHGSITIQEDLRRTEMEKLKVIEESFSSAERQQYVDQTIAFHQYQETEDSPEAIATLPKLQVSDLSPVNEECTGHIIEQPYTTVLTPQQTNGIAYLDITFNLQHLSQAEQQYISILTEYFGRLPTKRYSAEDLAQEVDDTSGGIDASFLIRPLFGQKGNVSMLVISAKFLTEKAEKVLELIDEMVQRIDFTDRERLLRILAEQKAEYEEDVISSGHAYALSYSRAAIHPTFKKAQAFSGIQAIQWLQQQSAEQTDKQLFVDQCRAVWRKVVHTTPILHITAEASVQQGLLQKVVSMLNGWSIAASENISAEDDSIIISRATAFAIPAQVSYQASSLPIVFSRDLTRGSLIVIQKLLNIDYLWKKVRQLGGAYGSGVVFDLGAGLMSLYSYRDPNISSTYQTFREAGEYLCQIAGAISQREVDDCIIAAIAQMDYPLTVQEKGFDWFVRHLVAYTDDQRQIIRTEILTTTKENIYALGEYLKSVPPESISITTIGNKDLIEKPENRELFEVVSNI